MQADGLLDGPVVIQEKIDGSQFSFGVVEGKLLMRSKGVMIDEVEKHEGIFKEACTTAQRIFDSGGLVEGMVVRGEALSKPKHNTIRYERVPIGNVIIWDISLGDGSEIYLQPDEVKKFINTWGLEMVPTYHIGPITGGDLGRLAEELLKKTSILGNVQIEGIVIKNYAKVDGFGKMMAAKMVNAEFKEANGAEWDGKKQSNVIQGIIEDFNKENIWRKAVQHAKEEGKLLGEPKDIGYLIHAVKKDFGIENHEEVKKKLSKAFYSEIERGIMNGFPEWYKAELMKGVLDENHT